MSRRDIQLILFSSVLLILSFPRIDQPFLAWVALIPLLYAVEGKGVYRVFLLGWLCGFVFHIGLIYWIVVVTTTYGNLVYPLGILVMLLLVSYLSLYFGSALAIAKFIQEKTSISMPTTLPFTWVTMEYLRSFLLSGFPWENLGYSQYHSLLLIQCADITGVYGISFLIVFVNATLFLLLRNIPHKKIPLREIILALIIMTAVTFYGWWRLPEIKKVTDSSPTMNVGLIQGNIDQGTKWNKSYREKAITTHEQLTLKALQEKTRLIIWPEASTPFYFQSESSYQKRILKIISYSDSYLLLGSPSYASIDGKWYNFNSAFLLSPSEKIVGKYDKIHLVPYGEYVPLEVFPFYPKDGGRNRFFPCWAGIITFYHA